MLLLRDLDRSDPEKVKAYRLQVKARLYRFNYVRAIPTSFASGFGPASFSLKGGTGENKGSTTDVRRCYRK
jgi:hypothetical protein